MVRRKTGILLIYSRINTKHALYSSVSYDEDEMKALLDDIESQIANQHHYIMCGHHDHVVTLAKVQHAIRLLNKGKHEGNRKIYTDHLIHSSDMFKEYLANLFTAMLTHAYVPQSFKESMIFPIPKDKRKSLNDSENYRGITLSSILGKVLDHILMSKNEKAFSSCDLQFGFKKKMYTPCDE